MCVDVDKPRRDNSARRIDDCFSRGVLEVSDLFDMFSRYSDVSLVCFIFDAIYH